MSKNKVKNISKVTNNLRNVRNTAGRDVNFGQTNYNHFEDAAYYPISKEKTGHLEAISKFIIEKIGEKWGGISAVIAMVGGFIIAVKNGIVFLLNYRPAIHISSSSSGVLNFDPPSNGWVWLWNINFWLSLIGAILFLGGILVIGSLRYKKDSQCPECKKHYALVETGKPKEKEVETSRGYVVTQIRYYKCKYCPYTDEVTHTFTQPKDL